MTGLVLALLVSTLLWVIIFAAVSVVGLGVAGWIVLAAVGVLLGFRNPPGGAMSLEELMKAFCFETHPEDEHLCTEDPGHAGAHLCGCGEEWEQQERND